MFKYKYTYKKYLEKQLYLTFPTHCTKITLKIRKKIGVTVLQNKLFYFDKRPIFLYKRK